MYFEVNDIEDAKLKNVFLLVIGAKYYSLLKSLCSPRAPSPKTYDELELAATLKSHLSSQPLIIAERFKFHNRCQSKLEKGE